jgi:hypothetical protein
MNAVRIGLLGLGTVGGGTLELLARNGDEIARRAGRPLRVTHASVKDASRPRGPLAEQVHLLADPFELVHHPDIDIVAELIGGIEPARALVLAAINAGKHVVTANKALIAHHGNEIFEAARRAGVAVGFEAAVAGGIPVIKTLREGLNAAGWAVEKPKATMFVWARIPEPYRALGSLEFSKRLLTEAHVAVSPGIGFGEYGDQYVRFGLIENEHRTRQAVRSIRRMLRGGEAQPAQAGA